MIEIAGWNLQQASVHVLEITSRDDGVRLAGSDAMRPSSPSWPELLASFDQLTEDDIAIASDRCPSFDLGALASVAGLRDSRGQVPLDFVVPSRTEVEPTEGMDASAMFFLLRVDGNTSLKEIAAATTLSLPRTIEIFLQLLALGVVQVGERGQSQTVNNRPLA